MKKRNETTSPNGGSIFIRNYLHIIANGHPSKALGCCCIQITIKVKRARSYPTTFGARSHLHDAIAQRNRPTSFGVCAFETCGGEDTKLVHFTLLTQPRRGRPAQPAGDFFSNNGFICKHGWRNLPNHRPVPLHPPSKPLRYA